MKRAWAVFAMCAALMRGEGALVIQTDFGTKDGAVAAMKGVAVGVSPKLAIYDLSHENTPFDVWEAAYRLKQTAGYWPAGTVFVSVIDPGVGTERKSVVLKTKSGHFFVGPDNGTWTLGAEELGIESVREIDEARNRRKESEKSYTFHGRDVYVFTGARLAAGVMSFEDVGVELEAKVVEIAYEKARREGAALVGTIPYLDFQFGNVWTNLGEDLWKQLGVRPGERVKVTIARNGERVYEGEMPYARTFGDVPEGEPLVYLNSLLNVSLALNRRNFAERHGIGCGAEWSVRVEKVAGR